MSLVDGDAELLPKNRLDSIYVVFHKGKFFFHISHALEESVERGSEPIELLNEAFFHRFEALIHRGGERNVLGSEPLLNSLILRLKTFLHGPEDDRSLIGQKLTESLFGDELLLFSGICCRHVETNWRVYISSVSAGRGLSNKRLGRAD